eukprot:CAMPEP_0185727950 /NCGR_PEP_ID=MMETSP1171-20130828/3471_1 /TAXON_ID=374046 /ORGANISM="Helicotheca tamensis, Strain CCMP826" /LENGTH=122 /DNA_ID=CAMNT_0028396597 /DNA_START=197 /DNA_END=565 /DNA_ORIENTATION=-
MKQPEIFTDKISSFWSSSLSRLDNSIYAQLRIYSSFSSSSLGAGALPFSSEMWSKITWRVSSKSSSADFAGLPFGPVTILAMLSADDLEKVGAGAKAEARAGRARRATATFIFPGLCSLDLW